MHIPYRLYRALTNCIKPVALPLAMGAEHLSGMKERSAHARGRIPRLVPPNNPAAPHIWLHGASVGEMGVADAILHGILAICPDARFTVSTLTAYGKEMADQRFAGRAHTVFAPLDIPGWPETAMTRRRPDLMVFLETELWPNWILAAKKMGIPVVLANGRISPRSFSSYRKFRSLFSEAFSAFSAFSVITKEDGDRLHALGVPRKKLCVNGNAKTDLAAVFSDSADAAGAFRKHLAISPDRPVWTCGSIRAGEEDILFNAYQELKTRFPDLLLILAPRHLERIPDLEKAARAAHLPYTRRSSGKVGETTSVLLFDTMGELCHAYAMAQVVFCGGSLVPLGGQNLLEPAACGRPVLFGPSMEDFTEVRDVLVAANAATQVCDAEEITSAVLRYLKDPALADTHGQAGKKAVKSMEGAAARHARVICSFLPS